ncbi:UDP-N-acetylglucosamine transferase subunit ALG14 [Mycena indigotica]|uniref:UDP-N-acetylglucosamine transferase subunit ALG14 n=1 Tax=Mycena indigotica TaxID=2126181 RepID=A0A8H6TF76_9AGAR|nr:UDP-N-acetylglucosamine transferase subunit ALG14 [Mycena indigotica]KAF7315597.1 UDP-N-acetylglucosamine transferase subunit ALG14 [Mycena indigotica]
MLLWLVLIAALCVYRVYSILPSRRRRLTRSETKALAVFLGSGGHTKEALTLISALDFARYRPRTYIISDGDTFSLQKAVDLENLKATATCPADYSLITVPRARRLHQPLYTIPPTALRALLSCIYYLTFASRPLGDVLILNGPGTCLVLCIAVYINKFLGIAAPRLIYIESFARVESLSLSGKLLHPLVDRFIVQWKQLAEKVKGAEFYELLV